MKIFTRPTLTRTGHDVYVSNSDERARNAETKRPPSELLKTLVNINIEDLWLEVPIGRGAWLAAYRLLPQNGTPVIAEVRLFPNQRADGVAGSWLGELLGTRATVPPGGVTHGLLRELRVGALAKVMGKIFDNIRKQPGAEEEMLTKYGITDSPPTVLPGGRRGRKPFPDAFYARIARSYVDAFKKGSDSPAADVARELGLPQRRRGRVRDMLHEARARGLLTRPPGAARHGGDLTAKAAALLTSVTTKQPVRKTKERRHPV